MPRPDPAPVELAGVTVSVGEHRLVEDLSLRLEPGDWHAVLGPNGSGKTTMMRAALGLVRPAAGTVRLLGQAPPARTGEVGVSFGPRLLHPSRRARQELSLRLQPLGGTRADLELAWEQTGLSDRGVRCGDLSLGQAQRLSVVAALLGRPRLVVLDEPTVGLDLAAVHWLRGRLQELCAQGTTVWVSSHDLSEVERSASAVSVLAQGRLLHTGPLSALVSDEPAVLLRSVEPERLADVLSAAGLQHAPADGGVRVHGADPVVLGRLLAREGVPLLTMVGERDALETRLQELLAASAAPVRAVVGAGA